MSLSYTSISRSQVARHPQPIGAVQFYGGAFFNGRPTLWYDYFLGEIYRAGYTVIAPIVPSGLDHTRTAYTLLEERDAVRQALPELGPLRHFWVGHSMGCKLIGLIQAYTDPKRNAFAAPGLAGPERAGALHEPALLLAPDISDTRDAVPFAWLARLLDKLERGVKPSRAEMQALIGKSGLFHLTGIISFSADTIAGTVKDPPETSDVAWLVQTLQQRTRGKLLHDEIPGDHLAPIGVTVRDQAFDVDLGDFDPRVTGPRALEPRAIQLLVDLGKRKAGGTTQAG